MNPNRQHTGGHAFAVSTRGLTKHFNGRAAVDSLSLSVPAGSIYGFLGPNGAGKSTTMKMLLGLCRPDSGEISILGRRLGRDGGDPARIAILRDVGSLIESPACYGNLTGYENLKITCILRGLPLSEIGRVLEIVGMEGQAGKKAGHYSLGMKQRLGIANALLGAPKLLLLDEPTNGLDPSGIHEMRELIRSLPEQYGITVMLSSHLLSEVDQTADFIGILSDGRLIFQDSLESLHSLSPKRLLIRTSDNRAAARVLDLESALSPVTLKEDALFTEAVPDREAGRIARLLTGAGIELYRLEERSERLEDIYLAMIGKGGL